jgi:hypothetical protein
MASKCVSNQAPLQPPSSHYHSLQVHLRARSITASKYIFQQWQWVYEDTGVTEVDRVTGNLYSADPGVYSHHLISISSHYAMEILTLSFRPFGLTHSVRDILEPRN